MIRIQDQFFDKVGFLSTIEFEKAIEVFFVNLHSLKDDDELRDVVSAIVRQKKNFSLEHLAYMFWVAFVYISNNLNESEFSAALIKDVILANRMRFVELCVTKNINANFLSRYSILKIILSLIESAPYKTDVVLDLGCSVGFGVMSLNTELIHNMKTLSNDLMGLLKLPLKEHIYIGVDVIQFDAIDWKWIDACCSPSLSVANFNNSDSLNSWLHKNGVPTMFFTCDLFDSKLFDLVPTGAIDFIWTSNVLFQVSDNLPYALHRVIPVISRLLSPRGVWVNADYNSWTTTFGEGNNPYVAEARFAWNLNVAYEVLKSPNDLVNSINYGKDYALFEKILNGFVK